MQLCHIHASQANGREPPPAAAAVMTAGDGPRTSEPAEPTKEDPFRAVAEAMERAAQQLQDSSSEDPDDAGSKAPRAAGGAISRALYSTSYCVGYGVAFPSFLVLAMVPTDNIMGRGLRDGASSAKQSVQRRQQARAAKKAAKDDAQR